MSKQELIDRLMYLAEHAPLRSMPAAFEHPLDVELTIPQLRTVNFLSRGPERMSEIAAFLGIGLSSATGMVDRLVEKGLVERTHDRSDRRVVTCRLTDLGRRTFQQHMQIGRSHVEQMADMLQEPELEKIVEAIEILMAAFAREAAKR